MSDVTFTEPQLKKLLNLPDNVNMEPSVAHLINEYISMFVDEATLRSVENSASHTNKTNNTNANTNSITEIDLGEVAGCLLLDM